MPRHTTAGSPQERRIVPAPRTVQGGLLHGSRRCRHQGNPDGCSASQAMDHPGCRQGQQTYRNRSSRPHAARSRAPRSKPRPAPDTPRPATAQGSEADDAWSIALAWNGYAMAPARRPLRDAKYAHSFDEIEVGYLKNEQIFTVKELSSLNLVCFRQDRCSYRTAYLTQSLHSNIRSLQHAANSSK